MKKLFCLALFFFCSIILFAQSGKEAKVWQRVAALGKAVFDTKDSAVLLDLVDESLTYGHSGGNVEDKQTMIKNAVQSKTTYRNPSFENVSIHVDGKVAIVRQNFRATSVDDKGTGTPLDLSILQVWKKKGRNWKLMARQAVKIPAKK
jgi:hypothetical protein